MKKFFVLICFIGSITNISCQSDDKARTNSKPASADSIIYSTFCVYIIYPLMSDKRLEELVIKNKLVERFNKETYCLFPLLILNGVIIREEEKVNCFRNHFEFRNIKSTKSISKAKAEKKGIPNVPKDGVLFVTTKKGYYFDFSCE